MNENPKSDKASSVAKEVSHEAAVAAQNSKAHSYNTTNGTEPTAAENSEQSRETLTPNAAEDVRNSPSRESYKGM